MTKVFSKLADGWLHPERVPSGHWHTVVFLILSGLIGAMCFLLGPYPITKFPEDTLYFLTQGNMLLQGYGPYVDYYSMHGPFPYLFAAAGMYFEGVSLESVIVAQVMGAALFGLLMFKVASTRVSGFWAVTLAISVELILVTCTPVGSKSWREFSCAMWYNAIGYCILATASLYLLAPSRTSSRLSTSVDQFIIAFLLMASFMTKVSYFVPVAVVYAFGDIVMPRCQQPRVQGVVILALAVGLAVAFMGALGGSIPGYVNFLGEMSVRVSPIMLALRFLHYTMTLGQFVLSILLIVWFAFEVRLLQRLYREGMLIVLMLAAWVLSAATSAQDLELLPMLGIVPLGTTVALLTIVRKESLPVNKYLVSTVLAMALLLIVHVPKNSVLSWGFSHVTVPTMVTPVPRLSPGEIGNLEFELSQRVSPSLFTWMPKEFTAKQIDALSLMKRFHVDKDDVLFVAADQSPLNMLTDTKYSHGYVTWLPFIYLDDPETIALLDKDVLTDVDWVLRDSRYEEFWQYLNFHRGEFIHENFEEVGQQGDWTLYRRKSN